MRILFVCSTYHCQSIGHDASNLNGVSAFANNFCLSFYKNHEVTVLGTDDLECSIESIKVLRTGNYSRKYIEKTTNKKSRTNNVPMIKLIKSLDLNNYDLIVNNCGFYPVTMAINNQLESAPNTKAVWIEHARPMNYSGLGLLNNLKKLIGVTRIKALTVNSTARDEWNELLENSTGFILFSGVINQKLPNLDYEPLDWDNNNFISVGRLDKGKNFHLLNSLIDENSGINLDVFCSSSLEPDNYGKSVLENHSSNVTYHLNESVDDKNNFIVKNRPMTISSSISETFGLTLVESLMHGLPIMVFRFEDNYGANFLLDGKLIEENEKYYITETGIGINPDVTKEEFNEILNIARNFKFDKNRIKQIFTERYTFNDFDLEKLINL